MMNLPYFSVFLVEVFLAVDAGFLAVEEVFLAVDAGFLAAEEVFFLPEVEDVFFFLPVEAVAVCAGVSSPSRDTREPKSPPPLLCCCAG